MATSTTTTTSAGMPPIATTHDGLAGNGAFDSSANDGGTGGLGSQAQKLRANAIDKVRGIADEGKAQVTQALDGIVDAARDIATKLEASGVGPVAKYATQAADYVAGWSSAVNEKSVEDLVGDTRDLVRRSPAAAVGISLAAGFVLSRFLKATSPGARGF